MIERFKPVPYLVQRLRKNSEASIKAGAKPFSFEYMGSAEFEFGALYEARVAFKYDGIFKLNAVSALNGENYVAYYVGKECGLEDGQAFFEAELKEKYTRRKELTYLQDSYLVSKWADKISEFQSLDYSKQKRARNLKKYAMVPFELLGFRALDGWWAIEPEYNFLLFKEEANAKLWIDYVEAKKLEEK